MLSVKLAFIFVDCLQIFIHICVHHTQILHHIDSISHVFLLFIFCSISNTSICILLSEHICLSLAHYTLELSLIHIYILLKLIIEKEFLMVLTVDLFVLHQVLSSCYLLVVLRRKNGMALNLETHRVKIF
jgi:hypothetical protein